MARKRTPTGLSSILAIDKPTDITSHDVINRIRRLTGERRVGHAGTLDPLASGLLLVGVGPATRLADYLMTGVKTYEARVRFGLATTTDDAEGEVVRTADVPLQLQSESFATKTLASMIGKMAQLPPAYSAIKQGGVTAYKAARAGKELALEPRYVTLFDAKLLAIGEDYWDFELVVSKGFYVRSFARDLGECLSSAGHVAALRRTASGSVTVSQATSLEELEANLVDAREAVGVAQGSGELSRLEDTSARSSSAQILSISQALPFIDPVAALGLPVVNVSDIEAERVSHGMTLTLQGVQHTDSAFDSTAPLVSIVHEERLLALYECAGSTGLAKPKVVIPGGVSSCHFKSSANL